MKKAFLTALVLYIVALSFRLPGIDSHAPQADELHWKARSYKVVNLYKEGKYSSLTTHLGQPGIPAVLVIAASEVFADKFNAKRNLSKSDDGFLDHLTAGRIGIALVTSLIIPLVFLVLSSLGFFLPGVIAGSFLALDAQHIALSRIAHLDSMQTLLIFISAACYWYAVENRKLIWKFVAAIFWGFCIAVKPTSGALIAIFLAYKIVRRFFVTEANDIGERGILVWSDVWAVLIGHAVFSILYTRTWHRPWDYVERMKVTNPATDYVYRFGQFIAENLWLGLSVFFVGILLVILNSKKQNLSNSILLGTLLFSLAAFLPNVLENLILYWTWAFGLSGERHEAFGAVWNPPPYGYIGLLLTKINEVVVIGAIFGIALVFLNLFKNRENTRLEKLALFGLIFIIFWTLPLSISKKQTIRYVLPLFPMLAILAAFAWGRFLNLLVPRVRGLVLFILIVFSAYDSLSWSPHQQLYFNRASGSLSAALSRGHALPFSGQNEVISFLENFAEKSGKPQLVYVAGDLRSMKVAYLRRLKGKKGKLKFVYSDKPIPGYLFVTSPSFRERFISAEQMEDTKVEYSFLLKDTPMLTVFSKKVPTYETPTNFPILEMGRHIGKPIYHRLSDGAESETGEKGFIPVLKIQSNEKNGFAYFSRHIKLAPGTYEYSVKLGIPKNIKLEEDIEKEKFVLRLDFGNNCERIVKYKELKIGELKDLSVACEVKELSGNKMQSYWFGKVPLIVQGLELKRQ